MYNFFDAFFERWWYMERRKEKKTKKGRERMGWGTIMKVGYHYEVCVETDEGGEMASLLRRLFCSLSFIIFSHC
jgi:hypothetical protein